MEGKKGICPALLYLASQLLSSFPADPQRLHFRLISSSELKEPKYYGAGASTSLWAFLPSFLDFLSLSQVS